MEEKIIATIEKKLEVKVENVYGIEKDGNIVTADVKLGENNYRKVELKELRNQYGEYYKIVSEKAYTRKRVESKKAQNEPTDGINEDEAMANLQAAQKLSETKQSTVYVMSNGKRTVVIKTTANMERHSKYGYWVAAIFEEGRQVSA